jgi:hypothetical protein
MLGFDPEDIMTINYAKVYTVEHNVKVQDNVGGDKAAALQNVVVRMLDVAVPASWTPIFQGKIRPPTRGPKSTMQFSGQFP